MIGSESLNPLKSRWSRAYALASALVVLPFGMVSAQDYEAVEQRLGEAVAEGEINLQQAQVMLEALRRSDRPDRTAPNLREGVERRINEIKELVERGEMSREEAARLIEETRRALEDGADRDVEARKRRYAEIEREIDAAVQEGKLSLEDAEKKLIAAREEIFQD